MVSIMEMGLSVNAIARGVMWLINAIFEGVGNYGVAVILFTLILKAAMSPLDIWQKVVMTKNNRAMERMKPQLEKLQKQYANNKELYSQKQMELYRKEKYSMLGSCLPTILSLVIFILVFAGFTGMIKQYNTNMFYDMEDTYYAVTDKAYDDAYSATYDSVFAETEGDETEKAAAAALAAKEAGNDAYAAVVPQAQQAVLDKYAEAYEKPGKFLWVKNVFMPDSWKRPIPDYETFTQNGLGKLGLGANKDESENVKIINGQAGYNEIMKPLMAKYNDYNGDGNEKAWNGLMLLPLIAGLITLASSKLMKQTQPPAAPTAPGGQDMQGAMQANMKMMQWFMPIMLGVLALLYSTAFTIYMVISNLFSTIFQLVYNAIAKRNDKRDEDNRLKNTYK